MLWRPSPLPGTIRCRVTRRSMRSFSSRLPSATSKAAPWKTWPYKCSPSTCFRKAIAKLRGPNTTSTSPCTTLSSTTTGCASSRSHASCRKSCRPTRPSSKGNTEISNSPCSSSRSSASCSSVRLGSSSGKTKNSPTGERNWHKATACSPSSTSNWPTAIVSRLP